MQTVNDKLKILKEKNAHVNLGSSSGGASTKPGR